MALDTTTDVTELDTVIDDAGNARSPTNLTVQKQIETAIQTVKSSLGNQSGVTGFSYTTSSTNAEALTSKAVPEGIKVLVQANPGNSGKVWIGNSTVQPVYLDPGGTTTLRVDDTSNIYIQTPTSGDGVGVLFEDG